MIALICVCLTAYLVASDVHKTVNYSKENLRLVVIQNFVGVLIEGALAIGAGIYILPLVRTRLGLDFDSQTAVLVTMLAVLQLYCYATVRMLNHWFESQETSRLKTLFVVLAVYLLLPTSVLTSVFQLKQSLGYASYPGAIAALTAAYVLLFVAALVGTFFGAQLMQRWFWLQRQVGVGRMTAELKVAELRAILSTVSVLPPVERARQMVVSPHIESDWALRSAQRWLTAAEESMKAKQWKSAAHQAGLGSKAAQQHLQTHAAGQTA